MTDSNEKIELITRDEVAPLSCDSENEDYDDPFASEKEDSVCELREITVHVPMVSTEPIILSDQKLPIEVEKFLEQLREKVPAAFDSKNEFKGRIYSGESLDSIEPINLTGTVEKSVSVLINDLTVEELSEVDEIEDSEMSLKETEDISMVRSTSKSIMSRFKKLWTTERPVKPVAICSIDPSPNCLDTMESNEDTGMPYFIEDVLEYLRAESQIQEGIFRLSGTFSRIQTFQTRLNNGERLNSMSLSPSDCHNVASLLKQFLRNLPEPLLTFELYDPWQALGGWTESSEISNKIARFLVNMLPEMNKRILIGLMAFLHERLKDSEVTRMNACNYGTVIGPNLLWHRDEDRHTKHSNTLGLSLQSSTLASQICTHFLLNYEEIFLNLTENLHVLAYSRALYDYSHLQINEDQIIFITGIEDTSDGWWKGYISFISSNMDEHDNLHENQQKFPSNYVKIEGQLTDKLIIECLHNINNQIN